MSAAIYPETYCSQCGVSTGPGTHGFSHCADHTLALGDTKSLKDVRLRTIKLHRQALDADLILSAYRIQQAINKIDAELARRGEFVNAVREAKSS
jgi:hypothetical protein